MNRPENLTAETLLEALDVLSDSIAIYSPDGACIYANGSALSRFPHFYSLMAKGATHREGLIATARHRFPDLPHAEADHLAEQAYGAYLAGHPHVLLTDDGRHTLTTYREMSDGRKAGVSVDITELHHREVELHSARREAEAASQAKSAFLANMSHEIRTPLNGIMGMAQVLAGGALDEMQREQVSTILDSSRTLMALLNDVLDLSKIEAGKFDIIPTDTDLAHVLRRVQKLWKPRAQEKGLTLTLALDCDLPSYVKVDSVRVQQCLSNLISNAIKFTDIGRIDVFARSQTLPNGDFLIEIDVEDTGAGMDDETMARLFRPFAQADETISRRHGGTGLGLSITRKLAEIMGGTAGARSEPGRGSCFTFSFRAAPASSEPRRRSTDFAASGGGDREALKSSNLRILLVDDHPINRQVVSLFLKPFNMRIVEAVNGRDAIDALERDTFDLVLLDMHMPVMDGPTAIDIIRKSGKSYAGVPVIALTADAMSGDRERYMAMGMDGYLPKPIPERDLLAEIMRVRHLAGAPLSTPAAARSA